MLENFLSRQFLAFLVAGGVAACLHWLARILLSQLVSFGWAVFMAYGVGLVTAFYLNRKLVFPASNKPVDEQARDFVLINLGFFPVVWVVAMVLNAALQEVGVRTWSEEIAHGIAIAIPVFMTFLLYKFIAFRENWRAKE